MSYHKENFIDSLFQIAMKKNEYEFTFYKAGTHPLSVFPKETKWKEAIFPSPHLTTWMKNGGLKGLMFLQALWIQVSSFPVPLIDVMNT